jgi:DNA-directed RNA polymerase specialized sigma24 family protein
MAAGSWDDIPTDFQLRIGVGDPSVLGPLAAWLTANPPRFVTEDIRQKVLATLCRVMKSARGRALLDGIPDVSGLLRRIATRHQDGERRARQRLRRVAAAIRARRAGVAIGADPPSELSAREVRDAILRAFARLSEVEREAVVRALVDDQSYREIAQALYGGLRGTSTESRIRKLVSRARRKLQGPLNGLL